MLSLRNLIFSTVCVIIIVLNTASVFAQITPPEEVLGFKPGADYHLATYEQAMEYFDLIDGQSNRLQMFDMGPTSEGRRMRYAVISSEENMVNLDRYKEIARRLSLARGISPEEAEKLAEEGKAIAWISGGLHASEVAPPLHHFRLAYDLVTGEDRQTKFIRDNVILLLVFLNPDGMTKIADWYMSNVGTAYEVSPLPELYQKYAGHDNNRDSFILNLVETRNITKLTSMEWFLNVFYDQHHSAPFPARIWITPGPEPTNPNVHPLLIRMKNLIGTAMGHGLDAADQPGAISRTAFDIWYPGYVDGPGIGGHNVPSILTETALYRYATPKFYTLNDFPEQYQDLTMGVFYPSPWKGGWWRIGDAIEYNLTASKSLLELTAKYRYEFLHNKWKMAVDAINRFNSEPPYGWIIPKNQRDANTTALLIDRFLMQGVEIYTAGADFTHEGISYEKGSYIIPTNQPFGLFVKNIFEKQKYPDLRKYAHLWQGSARTMKWDGAPLAPYDGVGWTLPAQMGVKTHEMSSALNIGKTAVTEAVQPAGNVSGGGRQIVFTSADNNSYNALNKILEAGGKVSRALEDFTVSGTAYQTGAFVIDRGSITSNLLNEIAAETGIKMRGGNVKVGTKQIRKPRIALYKSWAANMDAGWSEWIFDHYGIKYHPLRDSEVRAGNLRDRFDVIILPDQGTRSIINGHRKGTIHPDYAGGITTDGVENLKKFVVNGGTLICNKGSSGLAVDLFKIPVKNVIAGVPADSFNCPGSILKMKYDTNHPLAYGMRENGIAFFARGIAYEILPDSLNKSSKKLKPVIAAEYPDEPLLVSGWLLGEERIQGKAAVVDVPVEKGKVILFGFNVQNRAQSYSTFKLLFNAVYY